MLPLVFHQVAPVHEAGLNAPESAQVQVTVGFQNVFFGWNIYYFIIKLLQLWYKITWF